jgi:lipoprotein-releasing system permease protein
MGYTAKSWQLLFPEFLRTLKLESISNGMIMLLIMTISAFGIANVMNMLVLEKTKEIGMLMAMGATPSDIRRIFLLESGILGLIGGFCGCLLGYLISVYLNSLKLSYEQPQGPTIPLPFLIDPVDLLAVALFALILSIIAGVYPAHRASRLDPVEALRG